jgi:hypothetical protein
MRQTLVSPGKKNTATGVPFLPLLCENEKLQKLVDHGKLILSGEEASRKQRSYCFTSNDESNDLYQSIMRHTRYSLIKPKKFSCYLIGPV